MALVSARSQFTSSSADADFAPFPTTVLIADDDPSVRRLLRIAFEMDGFRTITASDGDEAIVALRLHQPTVMIVDAAMPGCNGTAVCRALRHELGWGPTVIMLTGRTDVADRLAAFECGVDDYLEKPIKVMELVERVRLHHHTDLPRTSGSRLLGSVEIYDDLRRRLEAAQPVAVVMTEIQGLRPYTRHYGFARGESLVGAVADLLLELARLEPDGLAGRLGAQDFIALVEPARAEEFTAALHSAFEARRPSFYDPVDVLRGWIDVTDRTGRTRRHRPVRLAVGRRRERPAPRPPPPRPARAGGRTRPLCRHPQSRRSRLRPPRRVAPARARPFYLPIWAARTEADLGAGLVAGATHPELAALHVEHPERRAEGEAPLRLVEVEGRRHHGDVTPNRHLGRDRPGRRTQCLEKDLERQADPLRVAGERVAVAVGAGLDSEHNVDAGRGLAGDGRAVDGLHPPGRTVAVDGFEESHQPCHPGRLPVDDDAQVGQGGLVELIAAAGQQLAGPFSEARAPRNSFTSATDELAVGTGGEAPPRRGIGHDLVQIARQRRLHHAHQATSGRPGSARGGFTTGSPPST